MVAVAPSQERVLKRITLPRIRWRCVAPSQERVLKLEF